VYGCEITEKYSPNLLDLNDASQKSFKILPPNIGLRENEFAHNWNKVDSNIRLIV
jgi:hypothetical protein